jgi:hypothetical protein
VTTARVGRHGEGERAPDLSQGETAFDCVDLDLTHEVVAVIEDVSDIASGLVILADQIGHAEVERRAAR